MPKRKIPITAYSDEGSTSSSSTPHSSRKLIRSFHVLLKKQSQLRNQKRDTKALAGIEHQIEELGGLSAYQRMSSIGQGKDRGGGSERVLINWLKEMVPPVQTGQPKLRLLEVGALNHDNYRSCESWIDSTPMDLRSRHPAILEQDFLLMDKTIHCERWGVISLSLVLNFVPTPQDRGRMLRLAHHILSPNGLLFLALPLPCVLNSRYLTFEHLKSLMMSIGLDEIKEKWKPSGKMAYWLYRKVPKTEVNTDIFQKKTISRQGNRNNFTILL